MILGGGRSQFIPKHIKDEDGKNGHRGDSVDLLKVWAADKESKNATHEYVFDKKTLLSVNTSNTDYLLGMYPLLFTTHAHILFWQLLNKSWFTGEG